MLKSSSCAIPTAADQAESPSSTACGSPQAAAHMNQQNNILIIKRILDVQFGFADTRIEEGGKGPVKDTPDNPMHGLDFV
jgi:hypothetical protein